MLRYLAPLTYLRISHAEWARLNVIYPAIFAVFLCLPLLSEQFRMSAELQENLLSDLAKFAGFLFGFYIAALAAVSTFGRPEMDDPMPGDPQLKHNANGVRYSETLTRRRLLSFLFGFLAFMSLALVAVIKAFEVSALLIPFDWFNAHILSIRIVLWVIVSGMAGILISDTLLGLYYLTDKMHRENGLNRSKSDANGHLPAE